MNLLRKFVAVLRRDWLTGSRYGAASALYAVGLVFEAAAFYFVARAVGPAYRPDGFDFFSFIVIGTGIWGFFLATVSSFVTAIREAQVSGSIEALMTTATKPSLLVTLSAASTILRDSAQLIAYLLVGFLLFGAAALHVNALALVVLAVLILALALAFGILAAAVQVSIQKGGAVVWLFGSVIWLFSGTMFPVSTLPAPLQILAKMIPLTYALDALRAAMLKGTSLSQMGSGMAYLGPLAVILLPVAVGVFGLTLRQARRRGTLSYY
ncbi:MAG: ABC transporter permease [Terriglobales bacterium]